MQRISPREILQDSVFLRKFHGWMTVFWIANFPPVIILFFALGKTGFQVFCLLYLALVSIWANVAGHWSSWQASRIEVKQDIASGDLPPET